jgi:hypothetical protein
MAKPQTRTQFKDYCLRRLGFPVITINVDDDQVEERIDDALQFFNDYHFDGVEKMFMKHQLTLEDIERRWIYVPDAVTFVTGVLPFDLSFPPTHSLIESVVLWYTTVQIQSSPKQIVPRY